LKDINRPILEIILKEEDQPILEENWNINQPEITQKRDRNNLVQHPNTPSHLRGGINASERGKMPHPLPKNNSSSCMCPTVCTYSFSSFPNKVEPNPSCMCLP